MPRAYGEPHAAPETGGLVADVDADSPAGRAGVRPGDRILTADGRPLRDVLDWQWAADDERVVITLRAREGATRALTLEREWGEPFGIAFDDVVFDGVRTCRNDCVFCFMSQLPRGLRKALYLRDDDYRLSFLSGNFITLTNLTDDDIARITEMRLTPLYVSLHAVDPGVRARLVCTRGEDRAVERLDELLAAGIEFHVQVVLVPGVNDGDVLERTLAWLADRPGIASVGVVPLGFTAHQDTFARSYDTREAASAVLDALQPWRERMAARRGEAWAHAADEFYLAAEREPPLWDDYDGFPQYENGIGLVRAFLDEFDDALAEAAGEARDRALQGERAYPVALLTGELFAPTLARLAPRLRALGVDARVVPVRNAFLGGNVSVAGLLTGRDAVDAVRRDGAPGTYLLPAVVVNSDGLMLDDVPAADLSALSGARIELVPPDAAGLVAAVRELAAEEDTRG